MLDIETSQNEIQAALNSQAEWLLIQSNGKTFALRNSEIEISSERGKLLFGFLSEKGFHVWRAIKFQIENGKISLNVSRDFNKKREKIKLVPRVSAGELSASLELARLEKANQFAALIGENVRGTKLIKVGLNEENGRFAQIVFENARADRIAVLADVTETLTPEILLSSAILWLSKLENRKKKPVETIWVLGERNQARKLQKLHALLRRSWQEKIKVVEISRRDSTGHGGINLNESANLTAAEYQKAKPKPIKLPVNYSISETAREIINFFPDKIDAVFGKNGETLRFSGLPFARVRTIFGREKVWFGIENSKRILTNDNWRDLTRLIEDLNVFRRFDSPNKQHAFYRLAPEAWLEAILRKNIKQLDANLILSPLYHQFRAGRDQIDLLALRNDGRLVIIEIKTAPDREMIFQAADYRRKIELQRRSGNLQKARLFGDAEIADAPAIVYLTAPMLSYHKDFDFLAKTLSPEIEIYRFNLNENWRDVLKVLERKRLNENT